MSTITQPAARAQRVQRCTIRAALPLSPSDFEVYRSGALFTLRCKRCRITWSLPPTDLAALNGIAELHKPVRP